MKKQGKAGQKSLTKMFENASCTKPKEFLREDVLRCVADFVVCDNQVSAPSI